MRMGFCHVKPRTVRNEGIKARGSPKTRYFKKYDAISNEENSEGSVFQPLSTLLAR